MKEAMNRRMKRRLNVIVPIALALVLIWVLYNLGKTVSDPFYLEYANAQQLSEDTIPADRGTISTPMAKCWRSPIRYGRFSSAR